MNCTGGMKVGESASASSSADHCKEAIQNFYGEAPEKKAERIKMWSDLLLKAGVTESGVLETIVKSGVSVQLYETQTRDEALYFLEREMKISKTICDAIINVSYPGEFLDILMDYRRSSPSIIKHHMFMISSETSEERT